MAVTSSLMEVQATGSDNNSGLFDTNATMTSTLSATSANTVSPVVSASNYTFTSNDVGHYLFVKPIGTWKCGWYRIASVSAGAATLTASIGTVHTGDKQSNTTVGISSSSTDSSGQWAVDYTQKNTAFIAYTDLVAVSTIAFTSAANPFTPNLIGNSIQILSGTGFTAGIYIISSLSGSTATFHTAAATLGSTGGTGNLGGALATVHKACGVSGISGNYIYVKGSAGAINVSSNPLTTIYIHAIIGYQNYRWDNQKATIKLAASGTRFLVSGDGRWVYLHNLIIDGQGYSDTRATSFGNNQRSYAYNCEFRNLTYGLYASGGWQTDNCIFENITSNPFGYSSGQLTRCIFKNCSGSIGTPISIDRCIFYGGSTYIWNQYGTGAITNNTFYNISGDAIYFYNGFSTTYGTTIIYNNLFSNISGYGINYANTGTLFNLVVKNNAFFSCTSGNYITGPGNNPNSGYIALVTQIQLSSSPFLSAATGDLRLNNDFTGGRLCRGTSISSNGIVTATVDALDIGAVQSNSFPIDRNIAPVSKSLTIKSGTTSYTEFINLIGIGYITSNLKAYYTRVGSAPVEITLTSQTVNGAWTSGGFVEIDINSMPGIYRFDIPNAVFASGSSSAILQISNLNTGDKAIIIYKFQDPQNIDLTQTFSVSNIAQTVGDALNAARSSSFGKWVLNDRTLSLYGADNTTIVKTFTLNSSTFPTERS